MSLSRGIYQHYKGQLYQVLHVATHSETEEKLVVYQCLYGDYSIWVRPLSMFTESISLEDDRELPRFKLVQEMMWEVKLLYLNSRSQRDLVKV